MQHPRRLASPVRKEEEILLNCLLLSPSGLFSPRTSRSMSLKVVVVVVVVLLLLLLLFLLLLVIYSKSSDLYCRQVKNTEGAFKGNIAGAIKG